MEQAGKQRAKAIAKSLHPDPQHQAQTAHWEWRGLRELQSLLLLSDFLQQGHPS